MVQLIISWFISSGLWLISLLSQLIILLPQIIFKPTWISQGTQWLLKTLMEDPDDKGKDVLKSWMSHVNHSIRHPHPPLTRDVQILTVIATLIFFWSSHQPLDRFTWFLEIMPLFVTSMILAGYFYRLPFTKLFYWLFFIQAIMMMIGAHYTYENVPLGEWLKVWMSSERNHYDRIGHFVQGFVTVIFAREVLLRTSPFKKGKWLNFVSVSIAFSIGALYELVEWGVALLNGESASAFLGFQGDLWDSQGDMFLGLSGAIISLLMLSKMHHRQYVKLSRYLTAHPVNKRLVE
jgi:putative membrane protein